MPTSCQNKAIEHIKVLIEKNCDGSEAEENPIDMLRAIRDEASLLYERQRIFDAFDLDPFSLKGESGEASFVERDLSRLKTLIKVESYSRTFVKDYSRIECVVILKKDSQMDASSMESHISLTFTFERGNKTQIKYRGKKDNNPDSSPPRKKKRKDNFNFDVSNSMDETHQNQEANDNVICNSDDDVDGKMVSYSIEVSYDYGPKDPLLIVEIEAPGDGPSPDPPVPKGEDEEGNISPDEKNMISSSSTDKDECVVYVNPELLPWFIESSGLKMNDTQLIYFLLMFPYYEIEWDIPSVIVDTLFGEEDDWESVSS